MRQRLKSNSVRERFRFATAARDRYSGQLDVPGSFLLRPASSAVPAATKAGVTPACCVSVLRLRQRGLAFLGKFRPRLPNTATVSTLLAFAKINRLWAAS